MKKLIIASSMLLSVIGCSKEPQMPAECQQTIAMLDSKINSAGNGLFNSLAVSNYQQFKFSITHEFENNPKDTKRLIESCQIIRSILYL